jgi:hypothetical protein
LLYEKRFTIEGARQALQREGRAVKRRSGRSIQQELFSSDPLPDIRRELAGILGMLK